MPVVRAEDALRHQGQEGTKVVASGPYELRHRGRGELRLQARQAWRGRKPRVTRLVLRTVRDDNIRALRLLSGTGDLVLDAMPDLLLPLFSHDARFAVRRAVGVGTVYLGLNLSAPALSDVRVREALAYAIDRQHIIARKLDSRSQAARSLIPPGHWAHAADTPSYEYDPKHARALLADSGVPMPLHLALRCSSERSRISMARVIAAMLRDVGVVVDVKPTELSTVLSDLNSGRFELALMELPELLEPHLLSWFFASTRIPEHGVEGANRWRIRNEPLDAALERGRLHSDRAVRKAAYRQVQHLLATELPVIPLWHRDTVLVARTAFADLPVPRHGRYDGLLR
jgi:peptide/nickel transport system substrate-binding protein